MMDYAHTSQEHPMVFATKKESSNKSKDTLEAVFAASSPVAANKTRGLDQMAYADRRNSAPTLAWH